MADPDKNPAPEPAPKGAPGGKPPRGERERGPATDRDVEAALWKMDPARLRSILESKEAALVGPASPKFSVAIDAVQVADATDAIEACSEGIARIDAAAGKGLTAQNEAEEKALAGIRDVSAELATAAVRNSTYRRKPLRHSLDVARTRLEQIHGPETARR